MRKVGCCGGGGWWVLFEKKKKTAEPRWVKRVRGGKIAKGDIHMERSQRKDAVMAQNRGGNLSPPFHGGQGEENLPGDRWLKKRKRGEVGKIGSSEKGGEKIQSSQNQKTRR